MSVDTGGMVFRHKVVHRVICDLPECKKGCHEYYNVRIGDFTYKFCSILHANTARNRAELKKAQGIGPNNPNPIVDDVPEDEGEYVE